MPYHEIVLPRAGLPINLDIYKSYNRIIPSHWHNHLEVLYILHGSMQIIRNDERYSIHENDLFIVNCSDIHLTKSLGSVEVLLLLIPYELINFSITGFESIRFREYFPHSDFKDDPEFKMMVQHLTAMRELIEHGEDGYQLLFISRLHLFLHTLYTNYAIRQNVNMNNDMKQLSRFKDVINYVELNYREPISLKEAASLAALNSDYFCRTFKKHVGFTFMEYVNIVRLAHIHSDILDTDEDITSILERHGFTNYKVFYRMFKEAYGCTPSKLRCTIPTS